MRRSGTGPALAAGRRPRGAFTLLELCIVLFIIALLAAAAMPSMESAFQEQALQNDAHQLSLMVRTAMIQSGEQLRPYQLTLNGNELALAPVQELAATSAGSVGGAADSSGDQVDSDSSGWTLKTALKFPDAARKDAWESLPEAKWVFQSHGLCPLPRVRLERGTSYLEMSFNALTGDVENESSYIP